MDNREKALWGRDDLQFPRLIVALMGALTTEQMVEVSNTMTLTMDELQELFDRASSADQRTKARKYFSEYGIVSKRSSSVQPNYARDDAAATAALFTKEGAT